ncbi:MAG: signal peptidase II [Patescibacteria group bacterium]
MFFIACVSALFLLRDNHRIGMIIGVLLVLGGGASNIIQRVVYGHVIDWIFVGGIFVTNIADAIIVIGVLICVYYFYDSTRAVNRPDRPRK